MSQYPPQPAYPGAPPQYGHPPGGMPPAAKKTSGAAIGSLICGILGCVPFITSLIAVVLASSASEAPRTRRSAGAGSRSRD